MKCRNQGLGDGQNILKVVRIIGGRLNIPSNNQMKNRSKSEDEMKLAKRWESLK